jgi:hypothetical protein
MPRQAGGITVVQEPKDAAFSEMPSDERRPIVLWD